MEKSKIAESLFNSINLISDYIGTGFEKKYDIPDFSILDKVENIPQVQQSFIDEKIVIKKPLDSDITKKRALIEVASEILKCNKCEINSRIKVPGSGSENAKIFVISNFPDEEEEKSGKLMVGETGDFFKKWIDAIKINFDDLFIMSLIKCNPKNSKISKDSIEKCLNHLDKQLLIVKPVIILALGDLVLSSLCKKFMDININHGNLFTYNNIPLMSIYHPKEVMKNTNLKKIVWEDLKKFASVFQGKILNAK